MTEPLGGPSARSQHSCAVPRSRRSSAAPSRSRTPRSSVAGTSPFSSRAQAVDRGARTDVWQHRDRRWCVRAKPSRSNGAMAQRPGQQQSWVPLDFPIATRRLRDLSGAIMPHVWHTGMLTPWDSVNDHASRRSRGHRSRQNTFFGPRVPDAPSRQRTNANMKPQNRSLLKRTASLSAACSVSPRVRRSRTRSCARASGRRSRGCASESALPLTAR